MRGGVAMNEKDYLLELDIDNLLESMACQEKIHFAPSYVCNKLGINDSEKVANYLLSLVPKKLVPLFEVECPEGDSDFRVENPNSLPLEEPRVCHHCGIEYVPDPNRIWLAFNFADHYIKSVKKNNVPKTPSCAKFARPLALL